MMKMKKGNKLGTVSKLKKCRKTKKNLQTVITDEFLYRDSEFDDSDEEVESILVENTEEDPNLDAINHKKSLEKLKETDPEFYKFLQQNDKKLLHFDVSDLEDEDEEDLGSSSAHIPDSELQVASDESDYEPEQDDEETEPSRGSTKVTLKLLQTWQENLYNKKSLKTIKTVVDAFHAALLTVADPDGPIAVQFKVEGAAAFNGVIQLCILHLPNAFKTYLNIHGKSHFEAHKSKKFSKIKGTLKSYLSDLLKILQNVTSPDILVVLLKHLRQMIPYTQSFSSLNKPLLRILLKFWSSAVDTVRVIAFLCIIQLMTTRTDSTKEALMKAMYIKYVENSKFVSENTIAGINFMRRSLIEVYLLDPNLSYTHAFLYIRQLAIHLRNALTLKKQENFQAVYNWQYINSLRFWSELVSLSSSESMLRSLVYPVVQIILGTIKLIPTVQYYPLRFHCCQMMINISKETGVFIPILPFLLSVLNSYDFNKKHKVVTMKPISFLCLLRVNKTQLQQNGFKNSVIDHVYQLILECAAKDSHAIYFPDLYVSCTLQLKAFLKKCKVANFAKKIKHLLEKIRENREFIETERNKIIVDLSDMAAIKNWENTIKNQGTPLLKFYESWYHLHQSQKLKMLTQNDQEASDFKVPDLKKSRKNKRKNHDDDDNSDLDMPVEKMNQLLKKQAEKKNKKLKKQKTDHNDDKDLPIDDGDVVSNARIEDWD